MMDSEEGSDSQEQGAGGDFAGDGAQGGLEQVASAMKNEDPFTLPVPEEDFCTCIEAAKFTKNPHTAGQLARVIQEHRTSRSGSGAGTKARTGLTLGDIEDFALGFLQHNVKLFLFG